MARPEVLADFKRVRLLGWSGKHLLVLRITESDPDLTLRAVDYRIAKGSFVPDVGCLGQTEIFGTHAMKCR